MSWYDSNGETAIIIINVFTIVLSILGLKYAHERFSLLCPITIIWAILMFISYYLGKFLIRDPYNPTQKDIEKLTDHRKLLFHLSLVAYYAQFMYVGWTFFSSKK